MDRKQTDAGQPGLLAGMGAVAANLFGLLLNRLELAALELGEMRDSLLRLLLLAALGIVALWFALACWIALIVVLAWDAMGWTVLLLIAAVLSALALGVLFYLRAQIGKGVLSLPATMAELRGDKDALL